MRPRRGSELGQAAVEAAVALPIAVLLFCGCVQLVQFGLAHIVVQEAAFEAGRQAALDKNGTGNAQRVAAEICSRISTGPTEFQIDNGVFVVTHHLHSFLKILPDFAITHRCPPFIFDTGEGNNP